MSSKRQRAARTPASKRRDDEAGHDVAASARITRSHPEAKLLPARIRSEPRSRAGKSKPPARPVDDNKDDDSDGEAAEEQANCDDDDDDAVVVTTDDDDDDDDDDDEKKKETTAALLGDELSDDECRALVGQSLFTAWQQQQTAEQWLSGLHETLAARQAVRRDGAPFLALSERMERSLVQALFDGVGGPVPSRIYSAYLCYAAEHLWLEPRACLGQLCAGLPLLDGGLLLRASTATLYLQLVRSLTPHLLLRRRARAATGPTDVVDIAETVWRFLLLQLLDAAPSLSRRCAGAGGDAFASLLAHGASGAQLQQRDAEQRLDNSLLALSICADFAAAYAPATLLYACLKRPQSSLSALIAQLSGVAAESWPPAVQRRRRELDAVTAALAETAALALAGAQQRPECAFGSLTGRFAGCEFGYPLSNFLHLVVQDCVASVGMRTLADLAELLAELRLAVESPLPLFVAQLIACALLCELRAFAALVRGSGSGSNELLAARCFLLSTLPAVLRVWSEQTAAVVEATRQALQHLQPFQRIALRPLLDADPQLHSLQAWLLEPATPRVNLLEPLLEALVHCGLLLPADGELLDPCRRPPTDDTLLGAAVLTLASDLPLADLLPRNAALLGNALHTRPVGLCQLGSQAVQLLDAALGHARRGELSCSDLVSVVDGLFPFEPSPAASLLTYRLVELVGEGRALMRALVQLAALLGRAGGCATTGNRQLCFARVFRVLALVTAHCHPADVRGSLEHSRALVRALIDDAASSDDGEPCTIATWYAAQLSGATCVSAEPPPELAAALFPPAAAATTALPLSDPLSGHSAWALLHWTPVLLLRQLREPAADGALLSRLVKTAAAAPYLLTPMTQALVHGLPATAALLARFRDGARELHAYSPLCASPRLLQPLASAGAQTFCHLENGGARLSPLGFVNHHYCPSHADLVRQALEQLAGGAADPYSSNDESLSIAAVYASLAPVVAGVGQPAFAVLLLQEALFGRQQHEALGGQHVSDGALNYARAAGLLLARCCSAASFPAVLASVVLPGALAACRASRDLSLLLAHAVVAYLLCLPPTATASLRPLVRCVLVHVEQCARRAATCSQWFATALLARLHRHPRIFAAWRHQLPRFAAALFALSVDSKFVWSLFSDGDDLLAALAQAASFPLK